MVLARPYCFINIYILHPESCSKISEEKGLKHECTGYNMTRSIRSQHSKEERHF